MKMSSVSVSCFIHDGPRTSDNVTVLFLQLRIARGKAEIKVVGILKLPYSIWASYKKKKV